MHTHSKDPTEGRWLRDEADAPTSAAKAAAAPSCANHQRPKAPGARRYGAWVGPQIRKHYAVTPQLLRGEVQRKTGERKGMWVLQSESGVKGEESQHSVVSAAGLIDSRSNTRGDAGIKGGKTTGSGYCEDHGEKFVTMRWETSTALVLGEEVLEKC